MLFTPSTEQLDPALLAFVKCHVTSPVKWEALRVLAGKAGAWVPAEHLARATHREPRELASAMSELDAEGVVEAARSTEPEQVLYRLPPQEPTSVVAHRLIEAATHSQELRGIIAAYLARSRTLAQPSPSTSAAA